MADLAWAPERDARDPDVVARMVDETCGTLAARRVRPLIAVRRAGKPWALRAIEYARRATHQARFLDAGAMVTLPTLPADASVGLHQGGAVGRVLAYQRLRNFRAGNEGVISFLKRCFGWGSLRRRSYESFRAYTWGSVIAANLVKLARHSLG